MFFSYTLTDWLATPSFYSLKRFNYIYSARLDSGDQLAVLLATPYRVAPCKAGRYPS
jgi:hypothetical protein